ncbi:MAG TPA: hypothetical protein VGC91_07890 [Pyrinomonadaceae bacterium]
MSNAALLEEFALRFDSAEVAGMVDTDDLESLDVALAEVNLQLARLAVQRAALWKRHDDLITGKRYVRRRLASNYIDQHQLPIIFSAILYDVESSPPSKKAAGIPQKDSRAVL